METADPKIEAIKKVKPLTLILAAVAIILVLVSASAFFIYVRDDYNRYVAMSAKFIPYPTAIVGNKIVKYRDVKENLFSIKKFYESQDFSEVGLRIDFSTDDGQKRLKIREKDLINKMVEDAVIEKIARENGLMVSNDEISQSVERTFEEYKNEKSIEETLEKLYGWSIEDFKKKIIRPKLFKDKLQKIYQEDENIKAANNKKVEIIRQAKEDLSSQKDFKDISRQYSEGTNKEEGGDLGWFKEEQLIEPVGKAVAKLEVNSITDIIESELGYHLVQLLDKKEESEVSIYHIRQIFVAKSDFAAWIENKMRKFSIRVYSKNYYWDKEDLVIKFREVEMVNFEQKVIDQFKGDPSVIY